MNIFLIQFIGAIGYTLLGISYFKKKKDQILYMQIISYIFFTIHYYLLNGITGAICNFVGLFALVVIYLIDKYKLFFKLHISMFFVALLLIINIATFQNIFSIFPMIASIVVILSFLVDDEDVIRKMGVLAAVCWLLYAIVYKSYIAIIFEILTLIDVIVALIKNNNKLKK